MLLQRRMAIGDNRHTSDDKSLQNNITMIAIAHLALELIVSSHTIILLQITI